MAGCLLNPVRLGGWHDAKQRPPLPQGRLNPAPLCPAALQDSPVGRSHSPARLAKYESKGFTLLVSCHSGEDMEGVWG